MLSLKWPLQVYLMELRKIITYRADFWVNFFGQTFFSIIISYFLWDAIFEANNTDHMNGFTLKKLVLYYLVAPIMFRIQQGETIGAISREIYEGSLNKFLIYPINFYIYKITTFFSHSTFYFFQLCLMIFGFQLFFYDPVIYEFSIINFLLFSILLGLTSLCYFAMNSITEFIAFWADNIWSLGVITRFFTRFFGGVLIPLTFFPDWAKTALKFTPFPYIVNFPIQVFFGNYTVTSFLGSLVALIVWTGIFFLISRLLWRKGLYSYSGVGI